MTRGAPSFKTGYCIENESDERKMWDYVTDKEEYYVDALLGDERPDLSMFTQSQQNEMVNASVQKRKGEILT